MIPIRTLFAFGASFTVGVLVFYMVVDTLLPWARRGPK